MTFKQLIAVSAISAATAISGVWVYGKYENGDLLASIKPSANYIFQPAKYTEKDAIVPSVNFENAAASATPAVVHIKVMQQPRQQSFNPFAQNGSGFFDGFGGMSYKDGEDNADAGSNVRQVGSGSGVLISKDGYIVTNNHVVEKADGLLVTLNDKKDYKAKVIGTDPSTDLAVIKIEGNNFPYLSFANSDDVKVGQWVLAIGYPLNLETTVTSGIISAKSRSIGINGRNSEAPIESFIQTDAAVNPGNSGGALVNTGGELIGINSAIASPTGSYAGYSYAIPSNLVRRVASDIVKYGSAKRAYLGVQFGSDQMSDADRKKYNIPDGDGVYVMEVAQGSAAEKAGIEKGDFITAINGTAINTGTEMVGKISSLRPGDKIEVTYKRNGAENTTTVTLQGAAGNYQQQPDRGRNEFNSEGDE
ncbi:PDZ domain-containing protein [Ilyomonas limi]|uniref:PDZ domain-containing protein n=1 Tax=Ilyomonas limi TaxID=2575867 RepID=A0A4U3L6Z0_9BACT|nr:trypsin-like peptidase domain-containing protein [Ilyomonas limi]TKK70782.1 PDZ domain-containing protein [Ilyomonas limi]